MTTLLSVNIGQEQTLVRAEKTEQTGIFKNPVAGPVKVHRMGLEGDFIGDSKNHGGPDQAVYLYFQPEYDWWRAELGRPTFPGMFGDNLTISELESAKLNIGDILHIGEVSLQVTAPRIPCGTLAGRMEIPPFAKQFRFAEKPGVYCRVLKEGVLRAGHDVRLEEYTGTTVSVLEVMRDHYDAGRTVETIRRILAAPVAERARRKKLEQLAALTEPPAAV